jgi:glycosyltransferase involved in cell wall biosynthesis
MNYGPTIEAVRYFVEDILPLIRERLPEVQFHIVGAKPTEQVTRLASPGVMVHGQVPDMRPYYRKASVVVVPLLRGGGTRLKILEAAASGKPVVSTSLGAEGLDLTPGQDLLVADSASEFADSVIRLVENRERRQQLGRSARQASRAHDWQSIETQFCCIVERLHRYAR